MNRYTPRRAGAEVDRAGAEVDLAPADGFAAPGRAPAARGASWTATGVGDGDVAGLVSTSGRSATDRPARCGALGGSTPAVDEQPAAASARPIAHIAGFRSEPGKPLTSLSRSAERVASRRTSRPAPHR
ncbi:MAG: hypothetical protein ACR2MZ_00485 [Candidatus Dormibacter sp.]|uniref:hypothetical protein n=1 Tax=Candidatus Dormibacter sp. TaxID=2973982 RepID=UPI000DB8A2F3|nr:MAG: hypothetical protein DLM66_01460 [Candidatus Dormibacteraeota bacterium]